MVSKLIFLLKKDENHFKISSYEPPTAAYYMNYYYFFMIGYDKNCILLYNLEYY